MIRLRRRSFLILTLLLTAASCTFAQEPPDGEMELIERIAELQRALESPQVIDRDVAEKELLKIGTMVLDHLEPTTERTPTDAVQRLNRIRVELDKIAVSEVTQASQVTLAGTMSVSEALSQIRKQTGNDVDFNEEIPDEFTQQELTLDLKQVEFWQALNEVMSRTSLEIDLFGGEPGQLRLAPSRAARIAAANPGQPVDDPTKKIAAEIVLPHDVAGIFDLTVTKISASRNLLNPAQDYCQVTVQVRWEPRLQPISIDLPIDSVKALDEFDQPIVVSNEEQVIHGVVQPEIPELEFLIPIGLLDRQIEVIKSLEATIDAVLPGRIETFRFKHIGALEIGAEQRKAGAVVTFGGIRKNDDLYGVTVSLSFEDSQNALESHQGWAFNNPMYLEDADGKTISPVATETLRQDNGEISIQYYFKEDPKELTLVYKTAAALVLVPIKFLLKNIPLP